MTIQRVLVPIDFSEDSLHALHMATERFAGTDQSLVLVHVVDTSAAEMQQPPDVRTGLIEERRRRLNTMGNGCKPAWKEVSVSLESGKAAEVIIATAKTESADLVIMGSHGASGLAKALFGSTTYDVARKLKCSVMIVKKPPTK